MSNGLITAINAIGYAAILCLTAGSAAAQTPKRELVVGQSDKEFQAEFDKRVKDGFAPISFSAHYNAKGKVVAASIWEKRTQGRFNFKAGLSQKKTTDLVKKMAADGFRLQLLIATNFGREQYSSIWLLAPGQQIAVRYGYPLSELMKRHKQFTAKGYMIHALTAFREKGKTYYTAAWEKDDLFKRAFHARLSIGAFMKQNTTKAKDKYRLKQVGVYLDGRRQSVACIWENKPGPEQAVQANLTEAALKLAHKKMTGTGHVPLMVSGMSLGRRDQYLVVWEKAAKSKK